MEKIKYQFNYWEEFKTSKIELKNGYKFTANELPAKLEFVKAGE